MTVSDIDCLAGRRIAIVEDDALVSEFIQDVLEEYGATVVGVAETVSQALALIEEQELDAVTLDGNLVGELSSSVARRLAQREIPFLVVTGYVDLASADPALGAAPLLSKPFTPASLASAIVAHLC